MLIAYQTDTWSRGQVPRPEDASTGRGARGCSAHRILSSRFWPASSRLQTSSPQWKLDVPVCWARSGYFFGWFLLLASSSHLPPPSLRGLLRVNSPFVVQECGLYPKGEHFLPKCCLVTTSMFPALWLEWEPPHSSFRVVYLCQRWASFMKREVKLLQLKQRARW